MIRKSLRCLLHHNYHADRAVAAKCHSDLADRRHWELSTPSRSLPVLAVLHRSGVLLDGLEKVASKSLASMSPCMTKGELSLLRKFSTYFQSSSQRDSAASSAECRQEENEWVMKAYSTVYSSGAIAIPSTVSRCFIEQLSLPFAIMLLEMLLCHNVLLESESDGSRKVLLIYSMGHIVDILSLGGENANFTNVIWLLSILHTNNHVDKGQMPCVEASHLFGSCVRVVHNMMPSLSLEQQILTWLALEDCGDYKRPFIVLSEMERRMETSSMEEYNRVGRRTLLRFMDSSFSRKKITLCLQLCLYFYQGSRISEMDGEQCAQLFSILASLQSSCKYDFALSLASHDEWERLHECLFAQTFLQANSLSSLMCLSILDQSELINVSSWGMTVPQMVAEKLKKRIISECRRCAKKEQFDESIGAVEESIRVLLALEALLLRCTVTPLYPADEIALKDCVHALQCAIVKLP